MRRFWPYLRQWFCRHDYGLMVDWRPQELCIYVGCHKCGKLLGHFHLPTIPPETKEKLH